MNRLLLFVFRISPKTLGKQIVVYHSELTVLWCSSRTVATWPVVWRNRRPSASKCFFHEQHSLDLARHRRPTWWTVVLFRAHTHRSMARHLWNLLTHRDRILPTFLYTNRYEPSFERLLNCAGSNEKKSFSRPGVHFSGGMLVVTQGWLYLTVGHMTILHGISVLFTEFGVQWARPKLN